MSALRAVARRPTRAELEAAIRDEGGNVTAIAERLGATRQSVYTWLSQHGLRGLAGVREAGEDAPAAEASGPRRVAATVRLDAGVWKAARIAAVEDECPVGAVVEAALRLYLEARKP